jgi:hypothetical protein
VLVCTIFRRSVQQWSGDSGHAQGLTPLLRAVIGGHSRLAALLLDRGADPNCITVAGGGSALHYAVARRHVRCVAALLRSGRVDLGIRGPDGRTAAELAEVVAREEAGPAAVHQDRTGDESNAVGTGPSKGVGVDAIQDKRLRVIVLLLRGYNVPGVGLREACIKCGNEKQALLCSCHLVHYCSPSCQEQHWPQHAQEHAEMLARGAKLQRVFKYCSKRQVAWYLAQQLVWVVVGLVVPLIVQVLVFLAIAYAALGADGVLENYHYVSTWLRANMRVSLPPLQSFFPRFLFP